MRMTTYEFPAYFIEYISWVKITVLLSNSNHHGEYQENITNFLFY